MRGRGRGGAACVWRGVACPAGCPVAQLPSPAAGLSPWTRRVKLIHELRSVYRCKADNLFYDSR